jgi:hypothetical protein
MRLPVLIEVVDVHVPPGPVTSYVMCFGLNGFVSPPLPTAVVVDPLAPSELRMRTTAYAPSATTTTSSSGIHAFLNTRNTVCLLPF